ncbi:MULTISPECIES: TetR/AcrR family transcriptional regulator [Cyanophyceae]|uniref:TetR/AcrR family transcriptional regulator n=1 Tax=Cyanophyceae TaxID=3028117 RepID=UPI00016DC8CE|nr:MULTISPECIES: TetR/AcrR family transcriptional regulator [Cyanophyceae]ACB00419.1 transcriptional regulator, TetR family protein [Picosynechococcus sp. PCC 7002]SMH49201.1 transcriptional regulator, TetR family [Picosynechococcus sp. OG1]SMQ81521.1 transcriptional regulator, TetR family [Synechococcus sp. 7002]
MVGRKLAFNRNAALEKAMELFWEKGYSATSLAELLDYMGIQRQSLYNTFGNKHDLFLEAIAYYGKIAVRQLEERLNYSASPLENLRNLFYQTADNAKLLGCRGCFVVNAMIELAPHDPQVAALVEDIATNVEQIFTGTLNQAIAKGELPPAFDSPKTARYLYHVLLGLNTRIKGLPNPEHLRETLDLALMVLQPQ